jgi:hypothetical protein
MFGRMNLISARVDDTFVVWMQLLLLDIALIAEAELGDIILLLGVDFLMISSGWCLTVSLRN